MLLEIVCCRLKCQLIIYNVVKIISDFLSILCSLINSTYWKRTKLMCTKLYAIRLLRPGCTKASDYHATICLCLANCVIQLTNNCSITYRQTISTFYIITPESTASQKYSLHPCVHNLQLPNHLNHLTDSSFIVRMLFRNV